MYVCMCVHVFACICTCMCVSVCVFMCMCVQLCTCKCVCEDECTTSLLGPAIPFSPTAHGLLSSASALSS